MYGYIVMPWNKDGNHWVVLIADMNQLLVTVYDSLGGDNHHLVESFR